MRSLERLAWTDVLPSILVIATLAGALALVISMYARPTQPLKKPQLTIASSAPSQVPPKAKPEPPAVPPPAAAPPVVVEDPTPKELERIAALAAAERAKAEALEGESAALASGAAQAEAEAKRLGRRETLVRRQSDALAAKAQAIETENEVLAMERDVLARRRNEKKAELDQAKLRAKAGGTFAVLPYKGPNGTWMHPLCIECSNGSITLQPLGMTLSLLDVTSGFGLRANPLVMAVSRELAKISEAPTSDGMPRVPYVLFVVRPDGIRAYYETRARLEPLGIAFGYELVERDWQIDWPKTDEPTGPPAKGQAPGFDLAGSRSSGGAGPAPSRVGRGPGRQELAGSGGALRNGFGGARDTSPDDFIWPSSPEPTGRPGFLGGGPGAGEGAGAGAGGTAAGGFGAAARGAGAAAQGAGRAGGGAGGGGGSEDFAPAPSRSFAAIGHAPNWERTTPADGGRLEPTPFGAGERRYQYADPGPPGPPGPPPGSPPGRSGAEGPQSTGDQPHELSDREIANLISGNAASEGSPTRAPAGGAPRSARTAAGPNRRSALTQAANPSSAPASSGGSSAAAGAGLGSPPAISAGFESLADTPPGSSDLAAGAEGSAGAASSRGNSAGAAGAGLVGAGQGQGAGDAGGGGIANLLEPPPQGVSLDLTLTCEPKWLRIDPGGYKLTTDHLSIGDGSLVKMLEGVIGKEREARPGAVFEPRIHLVVEHGGETIHERASRQLLASGLGWPVDVMFLDSDVPFVTRPFLDRGP